MNVMVKSIWFNANGEKTGYTPKISVPSKWLYDMGVTEDEPYVDIRLTEFNEIIITKHERKCSNEV